jgi:hypothetical protein
VAVAVLAVFFVMSIPADPAHGAPEWKEAIAEIAEIRDAAIEDLLSLVAEYQDFLADKPSAEEAADELAEIREDIEEVAAVAGEDIRSVMNDYRRNSQVQDAGAFAIGLVGLARNYAIDQAMLDYNDYVDGLPTTTTTVPVTTTTVPVTTTTVPVTTTTVPVTTTTVPVTTTTVPVTTTTVPVTTTTTLPGTTTTTTPTVATTTVPVTTTTTTIPRSTTTTTAGATGDPGGEPPAPTSGVGSTGSVDGSAGVAGGGDGDLEGRGPEALGGARLFEEPLLAPSFFSDPPGLTDSLTRILEPVLPTAVAEVVVSPLLIFELLWRAVSSSGRGLVMPISLLTFSLISLLWDRRSKRVPIAT